MSYVQQHLEDKAEAFDDLLMTLRLARNHLDYCGYGDSWEAECARDDNLPQIIEAAIARGEKLEVHTC